MSAGEVRARQSWRRAGAGLALLAAAVLPGAAAADDESLQFDLLMVEQSVSICDFPIDDPALAALDGRLRQLQGALGQGDDQIALLRDQAAFSLLRQKKEACAPDGGWRRSYDRTLVDLAGS